MERKRLTRLTRIYAPHNVSGLDWPRTFVWSGTREIENTFSWAKTDWQTRKTEKHSPADLRAVAVAAELGAVWECHSALSPWTYRKPSNPKVCCYPLLSAILCSSTALQASCLCNQCVAHQALLGKRPLLLAEKCAREINFHHWKREQCLVDWDCLCFVSSSIWCVDASGLRSNQ